MGGFAWVTLATNDSYSLGALVLAHSLRRVGTKHDLAVLITPGVTQPMREKLSSVFSLVQEVNVLDSRDEANLALLARPELGITFTKLHCWRLTQYEKCVFVDADTLVVRNCDELFEREELSAAPDVGWPDCFNSGVFVFTPSQQTFASLTAFAASKGSFDGGDQGLLNMYFSDWAHKDISKHLPFIYNMCSTATYSYLPAYKQFGEDVRIIHFIGSTKPWLQYYDTLARQVQPAPGMNHIQPLLQLWWNIFCDDVHPELSPVMASTTLAPHWHEYLLPMSSVPMNTRHHSFHDSTDQTYDEIDHLQSYFSEFRDPWENYIESFTYSQQMGSNDPSGDTQDHSQPVNLHQYPSHMESFQVFHPSNVTNIDTSQVNIPSNYHHSASAHAQPSHYEKASLSSQSEHQTHQTPNFSVDQFQNQNCSDSSSSVNFQSNHSSTQTRHDTHSIHHQQKHPENTNHQNHEHHSKITHETEREHQQSRDDMDLSDNNCRLLDRLTDQSINDENSRNEGAPLQSHSQTYKESENISTHSNVNTSEIYNSNSGIAGALAQLTLGEARNPEQVALEEHMRKCGWEQGQIDYMGRDSFDNIWKKICGTLDAGPPKRDTTPPKEKSPELEKEQSPVLSTSKTAAAATTEKKAAAAEEAVPLKPDAITEFQRDKLEQEETQIPEQTSKNIQTQMSLEEIREASVPTIQQSSSENPDILRLTAAPPVLSLTASPPILSLTTSPPILSIKEAGEKYKQLEKAQATAESAEPNEKPTETVTVIPLGFTSPMTYESTTSLDLAASQSAPTDSQVPIQVAESVLEADIKEIVTEDMKPVTEEAISSISAPIQESVSAVVETLEAAVPAQAPPLLERVVSQPNGNAGFDSDIRSDEEVPVSRVSAASTAAGSPLVGVPAPVLESSAHQAAVPRAAAVEKPLSEQLPASISEQLPKPVTEQLPKPVSEQLPKPVSEQLPKPVPEQLPKPVSEQLPTPISEQLPKPVPEQLPKPVPEQLPKPVSEQPPKPVSEQPPTAVQPDSPSAVPEKPTKATESSSSSKPPPSAKIQIPGTPTITEATPPTSPQFELAETQPSKSPPKTTKRVIKKTSSDEKTESSEADEVKKPVKKVVKKIVKKPKEGQADGAEGSSTSMEKPKKIVKVVKKNVKPSETLSTDSSVPETPPPVSSEAPVPPKRKVKPATTKTAAKKPDDQ